MAGGSNGELFASSTICMNYPWAHRLSMTTWAEQFVAGYAFHFIVINANGRLGVPATICGRGITGQHLFNPTDPQAPPHSCVDQRRSWLESVDRKAPQPPAAMIG